MKFIRTKKLVFANNKGGVGKTTLAFNTAVKFAENGYKVVLVDLDPQCNLSRLALGTQFEDNLFSEQQNNIYKILTGVIEGGGDIEIDEDLEKITKNLLIVPGSLQLSKYENLLITAYGQAAAGEEIGYFQTSAINRFLNTKGLKEEIDIFIIDTSPSLGLLNRIIFLSADYFIAPLMPDAFSLQGIENLGITFEEWRENWKNTGKALAKSITHEKVLPAENIFIGYVMNSYNQYAQQPIKSHRNWMEKIPSAIKKYLSEKHSKNGLVTSSWQKSLVDIKDYGELPTDAQKVNKAIFNLSPDKKECATVLGTLDNLEKACQEFEVLFKNIENILKKY